MSRVAALAMAQPPRAPVMPARHTPVPEPLEVTITGELLQAAELRMRTRKKADPVPMLVLLLAQHLRAPLHAVMEFGEGSAAYWVAHAKARALPRGARVEIRGSGIAASRVNGVGMVVSLATVHSVRPLDAPFDAAMLAANDHTNTDRGDTP